jgi:2-amino-4-hydroxy-6-hydroxymethyldihydropteridine diphosphokinase
MFTPVYLGLGSNIGNREEYLDKALESLGAHPGIQLVSVSSFLNTKAVTEYEQSDYLNAACELRTLLSARELLKFTQEVEISLGRDSKGDGSPRTIDIDILMYGDEVISEDDFVVPHPLMHERPFVLEPLQEIAPKLVHPLFQEPVDSLLSLVGGY